MAKHTEIKKAADGRFEVFKNGFKVFVTTSEAVAFRVAGTGRPMHTAHGMMH